MRERAAVLLELLPALADAYVMCNDERNKL